MGMRRLSVLIRGFIKLELLLLYVFAVSLLPKLQQCSVIIVLIGDVRLIVFGDIIISNYIL